MTECNICCEKYNKANNFKIVCAYSDCAYCACKKCVRTYLLSTTNDPHCMACKKPWEYEFLIENLNKTFIDKDFKNWRKTVLVDRQISRTPQLMLLVSQQIEKEELTKQYNDMFKNISVLYKEIKNINNTIHDYKKQLRNLKNQIYNINDNNELEIERKQFIMPCPSQDCKGFLSSQYKCEICKINVCKDCHLPIGIDKSLKDTHVCNPDDVESTKNIKKETRPCPKCGTRIFKIAGCDQMWCTICHTAFSWNTNKIIITNQIHNPHFTEYINNTNNLNIRNPHDVLCGGLVDAFSFRNINRLIKHMTTNVHILQYLKFIKKYKNTVFYNPVLISKIISNLHRLASHFNNIDLVHMRTQVNQLQNYDEITVDYIRNIISKDTLSNSIIKNDKSRKKSMQIIHIYELISVVLIEGFASILEYANNIYDKKDKVDCTDYHKFYDKVVEFIYQFNNLVPHVNNLFSKISINYSQSVMCIIKLYDIDCSGDYFKYDDYRNYYKFDFIKYNKKSNELYCESQSTLLDKHFQNDSGASSSSNNS